MKLGLIGNPNVGKSLIFNQLTGLGVEVSNYPGTTIGLAHGSVCYDQERLDVIDLPGVYTLDGTGEEERLVRDCLSSGGIDVAAVVMDAVHFERNLYLLLQVVEYGLPMIVVLNMMDEAEAQGFSIDTALLGEILGIEVVSTAAITGRNVADIIPAATDQGEGCHSGDPLRPPYRGCREEPRVDIPDHQDPGIARTPGHRGRLRDDRICKGACMQR